MVLQIWICERFAQNFNFEETIAVFEEVAVITKTSLLIGYSGTPEHCTCLV